jgi:hypothetical protein
LYIGGLKVEALRADLMTNRPAGKYESLIALHNDASKNSLWRSAAVNTPRNGSSNTSQTRGNAPMPMPSYKRPYGSIGQNNHISHGSFRGNGSKGASSSKITWGHLKDAKAFEVVHF